MEGVATVTHVSIATPAKPVARFFGRPKLINAGISRLLFQVVRARLGAVRVANRIRYRSEPPHPSSEAARVAVETWLARGFDKLNLGGGNKVLQGFVNIDFVPHPAVEREVVADLRDLSFLPSGRFAHVHANHVIEHLDASACAGFLRDAHRALRPGGLLTLRAPNGLGVCYGFFFGEVLEGDAAGFIRAGFPPDEDLANPLDKWYHGDVFALLHWLFGSSGRIENQHFQVLTPSACVHLLEAQGFEIVKMAEPEASNLVFVARKASRGPEC